MKTSVYFGLAVTALAITLQASPAKALLWGLTQSSTCNEDWPKWKIALDAAGYALWKATCVDTSGTGTGSGETLTPPEKKKSLGVGYGSDPRKGFGSDIPVTLPPDRRPPVGKSTGIPIRIGARPTIPPPQYFRPR